MNTLQAVRRTIERYHLLSPGDTVVVGVSGGPDSLCLWHVLQQLAPILSLRLHVGHLHHGLRGAEADADADFVLQTARHWGVPCTFERADVPALASRPGTSLEEAARNARYSFLGRLAAGLDARTIAVGHTADDQAETVLMHWLRGSGLAGLRGMMPATVLDHYRMDWAGGEGQVIAEYPGGRDLERTGSKGQGAGGEGYHRSSTQGSVASDEAVNSQQGQPGKVGPSNQHRPPAGLRLIRPLLYTRREDVLHYCAHHGLAPRFDRSNEDRTLFRNRLRHELLPILEDYNPRIRRILQRSAEVLAGDYALLRQQLRQTWPAVVLEEQPGQVIFDLEGWRALPASLQRSSLREAISRQRRSLRNVNWIHVDNAFWAAREGRAGTRVTLPQGLELLLGYSRLAVGEAGFELPIGDMPQLAQDRQALTVPGVTALTGSSWQVEATELDRDSLPPQWQQNTDPWQAWLDRDYVGSQPWLRARQPGDRFQPLGLGGGSKLLGEFFTNEKVPSPARPRWPLLISSQGEIAWVCGLRIDERAKVTMATKRTLQIRLVKRA